ncbi:ATP-binding protein [Paenibacillus puldeungensis]|uniref:histidine kinase n=1 Tax=Paenibacillus puldeungensis TaxID=696536 RepID=A0ABW3RSE3_9BACL
MTPEEINSNPSLQKLNVKVPNHWSTKETRNVIKDRGIGTYRLTVKANQSTYMYGLKTLNIRSSSRIFVNGKEVGKSGNPAASFKDGYKSNVVPTVVFFPNDVGSMDIVIQVANLDYYNGGIIQNIYLGSKDTILDSYVKSIGFDVLEISCLIIPGIYFFALYLRKKRDRGFLYFSFFCFAYALITATGNEKIFNQLFDFLPFMLVLRLRIVTLCLSVIFAGLLLRELGEDFVPSKFMRIIAGVMSVNVVLITIAPTKQISIVEMITGPTYVIAYAFMAILVFIAIKNKKYGNLNKTSSIFLLCGILLVILSLISAFLFYFSAINRYLIPMLVLVYILAGISALFVRQYSMAYKDLEHMSQQLIKADKLKDEFLINTSHEFKTPLHGIINLAQAVLNQNSGHYSKNQEENLSYIISIAKGLSSLVNDIIDFQSLRNQSLRLYPQCFDINAAIQAVIEILKYLRKGEEVKLLNRVPAGEYFVFADENRFKQIIVNLLGNSLKFTENGSVEIKAEAVNGYIIIHVEDTGIGMDEQAQQALFKGNMHTGEVNFTDSNSSGLGLSISKMLADRMGGDVYLNWSEPQKGSSFAVKLPIAAKGQMIAHQMERNGNIAPADDIPDMNLVFDKPTVAGQPGGFIGQNGTEKLKILIVDDEPANIKVLQEIFAMEPYHILFAYHGDKALEILKIHRDISIVLLDVMMPGMSGYEVCRRIRQEYSIYELPILLLTVRNTPEDITIGFQSGANDFLVKPFDSKELKARVGTLRKMKEAVEDTIKMETAFLQSQIKPHFLYNALSIIISLCYSDGERAGILLSELSHYLRTTFDVDPHQSFFSLKKEISLVKSYVELEKARFEDRLKVEFSIEERALGLRIPALIIQPIVENAIRHGLMKRISGGQVNIAAEIQNNDLIITVNDNGLGIPREKLQTLLEPRISTGSVGLKNVNKRLINHYGQGLWIDSITGRGTVVVMRIPAQGLPMETGEDKRC